MLFMIAKLINLTLTYVRVRSDRFCNRIVAALPKKSHKYYCSRSCPQCNKTFTSFRPYMFHTKNNCETKEFMCHICSQVNNIS